MSDVLRSLVRAFRGIPDMLIISTSRWVRDQHVGYEVEPGEFICLSHIHRQPVPAPCKDYAAAVRRIAEAERNLVA